MNYQEFLINRQHLNTQMGFNPVWIPDFVIQEILF